MWVFSLFNPDRLVDLLSVSCYGNGSVCSIKKIIYYLWFLVILQWLFCVILPLAAAHCTKLITATCRFHYVNCFIVIAWLWMIK